MDEKKIEFGESEVFKGQKLLDIVTGCLFL